jgi:plasmid stabilization system protein ParE
MAMASHVFHPLARAELVAAHARYLAAGAARAAQFEDAFDRALAAITAMPEAWPLADDTYRFYKLKRFPYLVYYRLDGDLIVIAAVGHQGQQFGFWKGR